MTLCSQKDKDDFFKEYENDLNFQHQDPLDINEKTVKMRCGNYLLKFNTYCFSLCSGLRYAHFTMDLNSM